MKLPNTSLQVVECNSNYSGQVHFNRPGTGFGYENTKPGCILAILRVSFVIRPLKSADAKYGKVVYWIPYSCHKEASRP